MANERLKTASFGPAFFVVALLFCGFALVAWFLSRFVASMQTYEEKRAQARRDKVATINQEANEKLYGPPKWIDKAKGTVQLPIETAMDLVVNDYQRKTVHPSQVKVDNPYPYGLQTAEAPVAAASPAPATSTPAPAASPRVVVYSFEIMVPATAASPAGAAARAASPPSAAESPSRK